MVPEGRFSRPGPDCLDLTIGRGGDAGEQRYYICGVWMNGGQVTGESREMTFETLGSYDFTHDGQPETVELETVWFLGETETARGSR